MHERRADKPKALKCLRARHLRTKMEVSAEFCCFCC